MASAEANQVWAEDEQQSRGRRHSRGTNLLLLLFISRSLVSNWNDPVVCLVHSLKVERFEAAGEAAQAGLSPVRSVYHALQQPLGARHELVQVFDIYVPPPRQVVET